MSVYFIFIDKSEIFCYFCTIMEKYVLPQDPFMLLSFINMKLRDNYDSLEALCDDLNIEQAEIEEKLKAAGFEYNPAQNKFW